MTPVNVRSRAAARARPAELPAAVFAVQVNVPLTPRVVAGQLAAARQGTADTKPRGEVRGGNKKPYRQKGTGRARQGSTRAPQFRHGGVVWGPRPHPYHHDVPKKMRRLAIKSALSDKAANENLIIVNDLALEAPRTKDMLAILDKLPVAGRRVLMMLPKRDENIVLSARNIPSAKVQHVSSINVVELLKHECLIMPVKTVRWIEMVFGDGLSAEEASARITDEELDGSVPAGTTDNEEPEESASESETTDNEEPEESASESETL